MLVKYRGPAPARGVILVERPGIYHYHCVPRMGNWVLITGPITANGPVPGKRGGFNGSTQHWLEVYLQESENLRFFSGVDLGAALLCPDPTGHRRTGLFSSGSIVAIAHLCFRSSRAAKGSADHRSRPSHPWPL